jgi:cardiolipin synthase A/B
MIDASYHNRKHERAGRKWRELVMELNGPVVFSLDIVFATDWYIETDEVLREDVRPYPHEVEPGDVVCQVVPSGPGFPDENNLRLFNWLIYSAQRRLSITSSKITIASCPTSSRSKSGPAGRCRSATWTMSCA